MRIMRTNIKSLGLMFLKLAIVLSIVPSVGMAAPAPIKKGTQLIDALKRASLSSQPEAKFKDFSNAKEKIDALSEIGLGVKKGMKSETAVSKLMEMLEFLKNDRYVTNLKFAVEARAAKNTKAAKAHAAIASLITFEQGVSADTMSIAMKPAQRKLVNEAYEKFTEVGDMNLWPKDYLNDWTEVASAAYKIARDTGANPREAFVRAIMLVKGIGVDEVFKYMENIKRDC